MNDYSSFFKGLPRHRYTNFSDELAGLNKSPYKWWRTYLQNSKDYWWICQQEGQTLDPELKKTWEKFGNVFSESQGEWYRRIGRSLIAEKIHPPQVQVIERDLSNWDPQAKKHLLLDIPLTLTTETILKHVKKALKHSAERQVERVSNADLGLVKYTRQRMDLARDALDVWCLWDIVQRSKSPLSDIGLPFKKMGMNEAGIALRLSRNLMPRDVDGREKLKNKANAMRVAYTRMLQRARLLMANAEIGKFPSVEPVATRKRWTEKQQLALDRAEMDGLWCPSDAQPLIWQERIKPRTSTRTNLP
jgi:hypothetical protein